MTPCLEGRCSIQLSYGRGTRELPTVGTRLDQATNGISRGISFCRQRGDLRPAAGQAGIRAAPRPSTGSIKRFPAKRASPWPCIHENAGHFCALQLIIASRPWQKHAREISGSGTRKL